MNGDSTSVQCRYSGWRNDHISLVRAVGQLSQKSGFTRSCLAGKENMPGGTVHESRGQRSHLGGLVFHFTGSGVQDRDPAIGTT